MTRATLRLQVYTYEQSLEFSDSYSHLNLKKPWINLVSNSNDGIFNLRLTPRYGFRLCSECFRYLILPPADFGLFESWRGFPSACLGPLDVLKRNYSSKYNRNR